MRLWHHELLPYLPRTQLLSQWRELNSIFSKQDKHVLINYIYEYPKEDLLVYSNMVIDEFNKRGYNIRTFDKMDLYFDGIENDSVFYPFVNHHDNEYIRICFYNLNEKYIRGQKDYDKSQYNSLCKFVKEKLK